MQHDLGAALCPLERFDGVFAFSGRLPPCAFFRRQAGAPRGQSDLIGDDEGGVKTDAKLADQPRILCLIARERGEEFLRARLGDSANMGNNLVLRHADAVVADGDCPRVAVIGDANFEDRIVFVVLRVIQSLKAQLVRGIRSIRNQLAEEDLRMAVQRMDHQLQ